MCILYFIKEREEISNIISKYFEIMTFKIKVFCNQFDDKKK